MQTSLNRDFGLVQDGFNSQSIGPTFGKQVARSAVYAIIFSLLVICAYVAFRFQPKYAVPVIIAVFHDILITAGVYSLVGREVNSATVAAFLTILGYSLYDTVIVFDRIRENVPRLPRAAFSQIVNRSMSEVLTRSLITGLSSVFLVTVLFVFGGATLKDFAFAMMVGILSGTYSSIFIASPVLTHWKEREPAYRQRRERIQDQMGRVPPFPEENLITRVETGARGPGSRSGRGGAVAGGRRRTGPAELAGSGCPARAAVGGAARATARARARAAGHAGPSRGRRPRGAPARPGHPRGGTGRWRRRPRRAAAERGERRGAAPAEEPQRRQTGARQAQAREAEVVAALVWFTMGIALWHFTVFLPDRFWGGIVGAFVGAITGAMISGAIAQVASGRTIGDTDIGTAMVAVPGCPDRPGRDLRRRAALGADLATSAAPSPAARAAAGAATTAIEPCSS